MTEQRSTQGASLLVRADQPLIAVPVEHNGEADVHYFVDELAADAALGQADQQPAIKLAGVWSDLDAEEVLASLDRIRHESKPTPPGQCQRLSLHW